MPELQRAPLVFGQRALEGNGMAHDAVPVQGRAGSRAGTRWTRARPARHRGAAGRARLVQPPTMARVAKNSTEGPSRQPTPVWKVEISAP